MLLRPPRVMWDIVEEHFEELSFLWEQRERFLFAPDWTLANLGDLEERLEAHADGLRIAMDAFVDLATPALVGDDASAAAAAAIVLGTGGRKDLASQVIAAISVTTPAAAEGIRIGLQQTDVEMVSDDLYDLAVSNRIDCRAVAADILTFHRLRPPPDLDRLLSSGSVSVCRLAFASAGRVRGALHRQRVEDALSQEDPTLASTALEAAALAGIPGLADLCRAAHRKRAPRRGEALAMLGVVGDSTDAGMLADAIDDVDAAQGAIDGLAALGVTEGVPHLLAAIDRSTLGEQAAEALRRITGIEVVRLASSPSADVDEFAETISPSAEYARSEWDRVRARFAPGRRYQVGLDVSEMSVDASLTALPLRSRRDAYLRARSVSPNQTRDVELRRWMRHGQHYSPGKGFVMGSRAIDGQYR